MSKINAVELYTENGITLYDVDGVIMTTTESVRLRFEKEKGDVNRKLKSFPDFDERIMLGKITKRETVGFKEVSTTYIDRDTMTLLVMGFTGEKAFEWKKQYIEAFNLMEKKILEKKQNLPALPKTFSEALLLAAKLEDEKQKSLAIAVGNFKHKDDIMQTNNLEVYEALVF